MNVWQAISDRTVYKNDTGELCAKEMYYNVRISEKIHTDAHSGRGCRGYLICSSARDGIAHPRSILGYAIGFLVMSVSITCYNTIRILFPFLTRAHEPLRYYQSHPVVYLQRFLGVGRGERNSIT